MAAPIRHRVELYAVRKLHLVFVKKPSELALRLRDSSSFVRLCIPLRVGGKAIKLNAVTSLVQGSNILRLRFQGRQCIGSVCSLLRWLCGLLTGSNDI